MTKRVASSTEGNARWCSRGYKALLEPQRVATDRANQIDSKGGSNDEQHRTVRHPFFGSPDSRSNHCSGSARSSPRRSPCALRHLGEHQGASPSATSTPGCEALASLALPIAEGEETGNLLLGAGAFPAPERGNAGFPYFPPSCAAAPPCAPLADSQIQMEIWLPAENWNGKFLAVGNGGWAGHDLDRRDGRRSASRLRRGLQRHRPSAGGSAQFALNQRSSSTSATARCTR